MTTEGIRRIHFEVYFCETKLKLNLASDLEHFISNLLLGCLKWKYNKTQRRCPSGHTENMSLSFDCHKMKMDYYSLSGGT